jgi:hypothetical protein
MISIPYGEGFASFVTNLRDDGASDRSIAAALNASSWADSDGRRWHPAQIAAMCWGAPNVLRPNDADSPEAPHDLAGASGHAEFFRQPCTDPGCEFHRRFRLLRAIRGWQPFDPRSYDMIWTGYQAGESFDTIAARLNNAGVPAPAAQRWSGRVVNVVLYVCAPDDPAQNDAPLDAEFTRDPSLAA